MLDSISAVGLWQELEGGDVSEVGSNKACDARVFWCIGSVSRACRAAGLNITIAFKRQDAKLYGCRPLAFCLRRSRAPEQAAALALRHECVNGSVVNNRGALPSHFRQQTQARTHR